MRSLTLEAFERPSSDILEAVALWECPASEQSE